MCQVCNSGPRHRSGRAGARADLDSRMRCPAGCTCLAAARIFSLTPLGSSTIKLPNPASSLHLLGAAVQQFNTHEQTVAS